MIKHYKKITAGIYLSFLGLWPQVMLAANPALDKLDSVASGNNGPYAPADNTTLAKVIGVVVSIGLGLIGVLFLGLMIYAGYNWMVARGDEERVKQAKDTIISAVIGLIIVIGAYAIWKFIFSRLF